MILIDSACSKSNHPNEQGLQKITTKLVRMFTANRSSTLSTKEGTLMIEGLPVRVSVVPTFDKTLVSLGERTEQNGHYLDRRKREVGPLSPRWHCLDYTSTWQG